QRAVMASMLLARARTLSAVFQGPGRLLGLAPGPPLQNLSSSLPPGERAATLPNRLVRRSRPAPGRLREGRDQPGGTAAAFAGTCRLAVLAAAWLHCGITSYDSAGRPLLPGSSRFLPAAARWPPPVGRTYARPT